MENENGTIKVAESGAPPNGVKNHQKGVGTNGSTSRNIIIDTDCGVDDTFCIANFVALHRAQRCRILGITTVCGNITSETAFQSTCKLVKDVLKVGDIPVFRSQASHVNDQDCSFFYGVDGHCGVLKKQSTKTYDASDLSSEQFLIEQLNKGQNITLVGIGPLTNLCNAEKVSPGLLKKCKEIIIMGGAIEEPGNCPKTNMVSEYNFGMDSEAAGVVLNCGASITLFPLDLTTHVRFEIDPLIDRSAKTKQKDFYKECIEGTFKAMVYHGEAAPDDRRLTIHDVHCFAYYANPNLYAVEERYITVDSNGTVTSILEENSAPVNVVNKRAVRVAFNATDVQLIKKLVLTMFH